MATTENIFLKLLSQAVLKEEKISYDFEEIRKRELNGNVLQFLNKGAWNEKDKDSSNWTQRSLE